MKQLCAIVFAAAFAALFTPYARAFEDQHTIPQPVLEAAIKRARVEVGLPESVVFVHVPMGETTPSGPNPIVQQFGDSSDGDHATTVTRPGPPPKTLGIAIYPNRIYKDYKGAWEDQRYLENLLFIILSHEMEHMPEAPTHPGGVPGHPKGAGLPNDPNNTPENRCNSLRQYVRDAQRICDRATQAASDPNLPTADSCKIAHQYCAMHRKLKERARRKVYLGVGPNCDPPIPLTNGQAIPPCPMCDGLGDCTFEGHGYTP